MDRLTREDRRGSLLPHNHWSGPDHGLSINIKKEGLLMSTLILIALAGVVLGSVLYRAKRAATGPAEDVI